MKGKVKYIDNKWIVEYTGVSYSGGDPNVLGSYSKTIKTKTLPLHPENVEIFDVLPKYIKDGDRVNFKEVLINPMGREVNPNNLTQNHSGCVWYAKLLPEKKETKEIKFEDVFNDEKREKIKEFISNYPKAITRDELIDKYIEETGYGMDMWSKTESETFTTIIKILYDRK